MYNYKSIKTYTRGMIRGLTKQVAKQDITLESIADLGLNPCDAYRDDSYLSEVFRFDAPRKITKEQSDFGKAWLRQYYFTSRGAVRKRAQNLPPHVLEVAKNVRRFELTGVLVLQHGHWKTCLPLYKTVGKNGATYEYAPMHWGTPELIINNCRY